MSSRNRSIGALQWNRIIHTIRIRPIVDSVACASPSSEQAPEALVDAGYRCNPGDVFGNIEARMRVLWTAHEAKAKLIPFQPQHGMQLVLCDVPAECRVTKLWILSQMTVVEEAEVVVETSNVPRQSSLGWGPIRRQRVDVDARIDDCAAGSRG